jgi:nitrile hydratase subunit beta
MKPRFKSGDSVLVLDLQKTGHVRIPRYIRGHTGVVHDIVGAFLNPEDLSVGNVGGPAVPLYRVDFEMTELWPDYTGPKSDRLYIEVYDHWLAAAPPP